MPTNSFYCPICDKNTRHFEISLVEAGAASGSGRFFQVVNAINEFTGGNKLMQLVVGYRSWKCAECTSIYIRNRSGEIESILKTGTPNTPRGNSQEKVYVPQNILNIVVNNIYIGSSETNPGEPWIHRHEIGFIGKGLDKYEMVIDYNHRYEGKLPSQFSGIKNSVRRALLGVGLIDDNTMIGDREYILRGLTESEVRDKLKRLEQINLADYVKIR